MKKYISAILINSLLLQFVGCYSYSYSTLPEEELNAGRPHPDESIILVLNDGSEVSCSSALMKNSNELFSTKSNEYYYLKIDKPIRILIGSGDKIDENAGIRRDFEGIVHGELIDSSKIFIANSEEYSVYWTKDNRRLAFKKGNYIDILPEQGTGYFICKPYKLERIISFGDIKEIKEKNTDTNWWVVGPLIVLGVALLVGWVAIAKDLPHGPILPPPSK
jgi:hypothetical protein